MKLLFSVFIFSLLNLCVSFGWAGGGDGDEVGNGGDAVVCTQADGSTNAKLFDFFEAKVLNPALNLDLGPKTMTVSEKIDLVLSRLKKLSPQRAEAYRAFIKSISTDHNLVDTDLTPVEDTHGAVMPANCRLKQLALHLNPRFDPYKLIVIIDRRIYNQLSNDDKAGIFLHEAIYNELISLGKTGDSSGVRFFNAAMASSHSLSLQEFVNILVTAKLPEFEFHGLWLEVFDSITSDEDSPGFLFDRNGNLEMATSFGFQQKIYPSDHDGQNQRLRLKGGALIELGTGSVAEFAFLPEGSISHIDGSLVTAFIQEHPVSLKDVELDADENILTMCAARYDDIPTTFYDIHGAEFNLDQTKWLTFDKAGHIISWKTVHDCSGAE